MTYMSYLSYLNLYTNFPVEKTSSSGFSNSNLGSNPGPKFVSTSGRMTCSVITTSASSVRKAWTCSNST